MGYVSQGFTEEQETYLLQATADILKRQKDEEERRKWTVVFGAVGAVFAAIKLGILVIPKIRKPRIGRL